MSKGISLDSLNVQKQCDQSYEFEYLDEDGKGTGVFLSVVGVHSEKVRSFSAKEANRARAENLRRSKRKKDDDFTPIEDDIDFIIRDAAARLVGWRGISDAFTPEAALQLCTINPMIRQQVVSESNNVSNFTKGK